MSYAALPVLRTPRLTLRPLTENDADALVEGVGNYDVSRWLGRVPYPYGQSDALEFLAEVTEGGQRIWGIETTDGLIGVAGVHDELGYWLARPAWGRGYGFEAAHAVVEHWFSDPKSGDLVSGHYNDNDRSRAILLSLGFRKVGESLRFAKSLAQEVMGSDLVLSRKDWEARQSFNLTTPRLVIRPSREDDAQALSTIATPAVARNLAALKVHLPDSEAREGFRRNRWRGLANFTMAIEVSGRYVGGLGFFATPARIGYFLGEAHWGRGLMTEALLAFVPELFRRFPINSLKADHFEDNPASGAILRKLGFEETGRDMGTSLARLEPAPLITYALTRDKLRVPQ